MKAGVNVRDKGYVINTENSNTPSSLQRLSLVTAILFSVTGTLPLSSSGSYSPIPAYIQVNSPRIASCDMAYNGSIAYTGSGSMYDSVNMKGIMKLESFLKLSAGWNGYNAQPFSPSYIWRAEELLAGLPVKGEVFPLPDGRVQFEFDKDDGSYLEFELNTDDSVEVFEVRPDNTENERHVDAEDILGIVTDFYG